MGGGGEGVSMNEGPVVACYQFGAEAGDEDLGILDKKRRHIQGRICIIEDDGNVIKKEGDHSIEKIFCIKAKVIQWES